jgi:retron-type reverse transcriptase
MRQISGLYERLCDPDHLAAAARQTVRGKRRRPDVAWFVFNLESELLAIREALTSATYQPAGFRLIRIRDPKPRLIAQIPIADRVVHTAVVSLIEPALLHSLSLDSFACRPGFGTHRAVLRLWELMRRHRFALHLDLRAYFASIDIEILQRLLARRIADRRFLDLLGRILDSGRSMYALPLVRRQAGLTRDWPPPGRGLPIGAYTSQVLASSLYLAEFDHYVKRSLHVPGYLRYVDDLFLFGQSRAELRRWRRQIACWLHDERGLRLKHPAARVLSCRGHLDGLGYRMRRDGICVRGRVLRRIGRRVARALHGNRGRRVDPAFQRSLAASVGVAMF